MCDPADNFRQEQQTDQELVFVRLFSRLLEELEMLLLHGAMPVEIDETLVAAGFSVGPFALQDQVGTEVEYARRRQKKANGLWPSGYESLISDRMVQEGRLGRQSVVGWYRYPGGRHRVEDPLIEDLVAEESHFARIERQSFSADEITNLAECSLADEALLIGVGIHDTDNDTINLASVEELGFPGASGGILSHIEKTGLENISATYKSLKKRLFWLRPANGLTGSGILSH